VADPAKQKEDVVEAYFNPKKHVYQLPQITTEENRQEQLKPTKQVKMKGVYPLLLSHT
jgi:hypothetical protein